jgi:sensor histidine kinase YesM
MGGLILSVKSKKVTTEMNRRRWLAVFFTWEIIGFGVTLVISLLQKGLHEFIYFLILGLTITNTIGLIGSIFFAIYQKTLGERIKATLVHAVLTLILTAVVVTAGIQIALFIVSQACNLAVFHSVDERHILFIIINLVFAAIIAGTYLLFFFLENIKTELARDIAEAESLKRLENESKLALLETRLNPHFLFNTLNAMLNLVYESPQTLETMILNLAAIYRKVLTFSENTFISMEDELRLVQEYLEVEKIRLSGHLDFEISTENRIMSYKIPPFIIENVVENAVQQSIFAKKKGGKIFIGVHRVAETVFIHIRDNGVGFMRKGKSSGFGIFNIRQLLKLLYGDKAKFNVISLPDGGTQVSMELPWESVPHLAERSEQSESLVEEKVS